MLPLPYAKVTGQQAGKILWEVALCLFCLLEDQEEHWDAEQN
jgi:hypothetical protein